MAVTELLRGERDGSQDRAEYLITGASGRVAARAELIAAVPSALGAMLLVTSKIRVREVEPETNTYVGSVVWEDPDGDSDELIDPAVGTSVISFQVAAPRVQTRQSFDTLGVYPSAWFSAAGYQTPDFGGVIHPQPDGSAQGVQLPPTSGQPLNIRRGVAASDFSETYYRNAAALAGQVNTAAFKGFDPGEVLFLGFTGTRQGSELQIDYQFAISVNKTNLTYGSGNNLITVPAKGGWEYVWIYSDLFADPNGNGLVSRPVAAYLERVFQSGDFSVLGSL